MDADTLRLILIVTGGLLLLGLYLWEQWRARLKEEARREDERPHAPGSEPRVGPWDEGTPNKAGGKLGRPGTGIGAGTGGAQGAAQTAAVSPAAPPGKPVSKPGKPPVQDTTGRVSGGSAPSPDAPRVGGEPAGTKDRPSDPGAPLILSLHIVAETGVFRGEDIVRAASRCGIEPGEMDIFHRYRDPASPRNPLFSVANMLNPGTFPFGAMAEFESPGLTLFSQMEGVADDPPRLEEMFMAAHCLAKELGAEIRDGARGPLTPDAEQRLRDRVLELVTYRLSRRGRR